MLDYDSVGHKSWVVNSDCESVRLRSTIFQLDEAWTLDDFVTIGEMEYKGTDQIDTILSTNFTVAYRLDGDDKGFLLYWSCTQWGEWARLDNGNCGYVMGPLHNGTMTTGLLKYKASETCSK